MEISKVTKTLLKLPGAGSVFDKINAALQTANASSQDAQEATQSLPMADSWKFRARQLEVELMRAEAEEMARRLRQRII